MEKVIIYTDGACSGNPGPGGWGTILMYKETKKQRFDKVSVARTQKIIDMIRLLGNCSNKNNYSYDEKDAMMLFQQIENALDDARACFNFSKTKSSMDKYKE